MSGRAGPAILLAAAAVFPCTAPAADPLPTGARVVGVHIARPIESFLSRQMSASAAEPPPGSVSAPFDGSAVLLEADIPPIYGLDKSPHVLAFSDDTGKSLTGKTVTVFRDPGTAGNDPEGPAQFCLTSRDLPAKGARRLQGTLQVLMYPKPAKSFFTMDKVCKKGALSESKFLQCRIVSRTPAEQEPPDPKAAARDLVVFEVFNPGASSAHAGSGHSVTNRDRILANMWIRLLSVAILDSVGGRVLATVEGISPDANKTQVLSAEIPRTANTTRFRFDYYEVNSLVNLHLSFSSGLGIAHEP